MGSSDNPVASDGIWLNMILLTSTLNTGADALAVCVSDAGTNP
jgi:hypothetical protein